jgi:hypothetical protein
MEDTSVRIILDRWPETEQQIESLVCALRREFHSQEGRKLEEGRELAQRCRGIRTLRYRDFGH